MIQHEIRRQTVYAVPEIQSEPKHAPQFLSFQWNKSALERVISTMGLNAGQVDHFFTSGRFRIGKYLERHQELPGLEGNAHESIVRDWYKRYFSLGDTNLDFGRYVPGNRSITIYTDAMIVAGFGACAMAYVEYGSGEDPAESVRSVLEWLRLAAVETCFEELFHSTQNSRPANFLERIDRRPIIMRNELAALEARWKDNHNLIPLIEKALTPEQLVSEEEYIRLFTIAVGAYKQVRTLT